VLALIKELDLEEEAQLTEDPMGMSISTPLVVG
jgi:hypothetical protein